MIFSVKEKMDGMDEMDLQVPRELPGYQVYKGTLS